MMSFAAKLACCVPWLLVGCTPKPDGPAPSPTSSDPPAPSGGTSAEDLEGRVFLSQSVTEGGAPRALVDGTRLQLEFHDASVGGNAGCNSLGGRYALTGGKLVVTDATMTEMACDAPRMDQEAWYS